MIVFSSNFSRLSAARIVPSASSTLSTSAAYVAFFCRRSGSLVGFRLVFGDYFRLAAERGVDGVVREIDEERFGLVGLDELHRLVGLAVGEEFTLGTFGQGGDLVGREVAGRLAAGVAADVHVEAVFLRIISFVAFLQCGRQVPLADTGGRVAGGFKLFGEGDLFEGQEFLPVGDLQLGLRALVAGDPVGDAQASWVLAGEERGAGRGADRARRVTIGEADAVLGQLVDMRSLVELAPVAGEVGLAQVVDQDDDDVRVTDRDVIGGKKSG
jgi:hypothetical protein